MKIINPATGGAIAEIEEDGSTAVRRKYERARAAQAAWPAVPPKKRTDPIHAFWKPVRPVRRTLPATHPLAAVRTVA